MFEDVDLEAIARAREERERLAENKFATDMATLAEFFASMEQDAREHQAMCSATPCERCERYLCTRCRELVMGAPTCPMCSALEAAEAPLRRVRASVPKHFWWAFDAPSPMLLAERVKCPRAWAAKALSSPPDGDVRLIGPTGAGKTSLAVAMLGAWVRRDPPRRRGALFVSASDLARARARHKLGAEEAPLVVAAQRATLLVLDDLGCERDDRDGCITDVLWERTNQDRATWITCGLGRGQSVAEYRESIATRYDGGFERRVFEGAKLVTLGGDP